MKKLLFLGISVFSFLSCYATINGDGFYRIKNVYTARWMELIDKHGSVDELSNSADLHALFLTKDTEGVISNPASVFYVSKVANQNYQYNISAQGTSLKSLAGNREIVIRDNGNIDGQVAYQMYGTKDGATRYISDGNYTSAQTGDPTIGDVRYPNQRKWFFIPISNNSDDFFGFLPTIAAAGNLYCSTYTSFAYQLTQPGMKAYTIGQIGWGMVEMVEVNGTVPGGSPVIIQCAGPNPEDNKVQLSTVSGSLKGNLLKGAYFDYYNRDASKNEQVKYNPATMRVLGTCGDGSLGFITADIDVIPANTAYLVVPAGYPKELKCLNSADFAAGVETIESENNYELKYSGGIVYGLDGKDLSVFNLAGRTMAHSPKGVVDMSLLPKGVYVARSGNKSLKIVR